MSAKREDKTREVKHIKRILLPTTRYLYSFCLVQMGIKMNNNDNHDSDVRTQ